MPLLIIYLLKVSVAITLFTSVYYVALRKLTFYKLNRSYLIGAMLFCFIYPSIKLPQVVIHSPKIIKPVKVVLLNLSSTINLLPSHAETTNYWQWVIITFCVGTGLMFLRFIIQLLSIARLHRLSSRLMVNGYSVRAVYENTDPFSFWKILYLNPAKYNDQELKYIIAHEQVHISQLHTLDVLLLELALLFNWFNPAFWLLKKAVKENLEFIADERTVDTEGDPVAYQYTLLNVKYCAGVRYSVTNNFNLSTLKRRIVMMNSKRSPISKLTYYSVLIPVTAALILSFNLSKAAAFAQKHFQKTLSILNKNFPENIEKNISETDAEIHKRIKPLIKQPLADTGKQKTLTDSAEKHKDEYVFYCDDKFLTTEDMKFDQMNSYLLLVPLDMQQTEKMFGIKNKKAGVWITKKNKDTQATAELIARLESVTGRQIILPGAVNGKIDAAKAPPITVFGTDGLIYDNGASNKAAIKIDLAQLQKSGMLVILDGRLQPAEKLDGLNQLWGGEIENVSILKGLPAETLYGDKGKNGAVVITTARNRSK